MNMKILIITNTFLYDFIQSTVLGIQADYDVEIVTYNRFEDVAEIYDANKDRVDGFLVSGQIALAALEKTYPNHKKPVFSFEPDIISLYRQLIELFVVRRDLDTHRVVLDFLLPLQEDATVDYIIKHTQIEDLGGQIRDWITSATVEQFPLLEQSIKSKIIELWDAGKIDFAICQYGSILPELQKHGIPCQYTPPEAKQIYALLDTIQERIQLERLRDNLPTVVAISYINQDITPASMKALGKALASLKKEQAANFILQEDQNRYYIFSSLKVISLLTNGCQSSYFRLALQHKFNIHAAVGYGIGKDINTAKLHADTALKESLFYDGSYLVDERQNLIGPLNSEQYMEVQQHMSENISVISKKCMLSTLTIQKLASVIRLTGSNLMTAQDLADHLGVTIRNANRILNRLQKGGFATIAYTQSTATKGRPVKVYQLSIEE